MSKKNAAPLPEAVESGAGQGGSYQLDPKTGLRVLIERTQPAEDQPVMQQEMEANRGTTQA